MNPVPGVLCFWGFTLSRGNMESFWFNILLVKLSTEESLPQPQVLKCLWKWYRVRDFISGQLKKIQILLKISLCHNTMIVLWLQVMKENVGTSASDTKAALTKLPSNTTATKLPPSQPPPLIKHDLSAKVRATVGFCQSLYNTCFLELLMFGTFIEF